MKTKIPIIVILGPTATGKSDLAVKLAKEFDGEVISADSRQVYKGLDIGTGKITKEEMLGIPHHSIDVVSLEERFTVVDFKNLGEKSIKEIYSRGKLPIICGGTGFYISSLIDNIQLPDVEPDEKLRKELEDKNDLELFKILEELDPKKALNIDKNNKRKIIRAIEIAQKLGSVPPLKYSDEKYNPVIIGLYLQKDKLQERILNRLNKRIEQGMIKECIELHKNGLSYKRMDELGLEYRYVAKYLKGEISRDEMINRLNIEIWHYAKRQITWFKRDKRIKWFNPEDYVEIFKSIKNNTI